MGRADLPTGSGDGISDWRGAFFRYAIATVVAFGPAVALAFIHSPAAIAAMVLGGLLLPALLILAALNQSLLGPFNLPAAFLVVAKAPAGYLSLLGGFIAMWLVVSAATIAQDMVGATSTAGALAISFVSVMVQVTAMIIGARMFGLFLRRYEDELAIT